jgi:hypothetical protein
MAEPGRSYSRLEDQCRDCAANPARAAVECGDTYAQASACSATDGALGWNDEGLGRMPTPARICFLRPALEHDAFNT